MPHDDKANSTFLQPRYITLLLASIACFGLFQAISVRTNADVAWYLYTGDRILDGARLGSDIVEVNAPLIILLSMGVEALARLIACSAIALLPWLVTALSCVSLAVCARISRPWPAAVRQPFLTALAFVLFIDIGGMVGQREHLLVILVMPYVCSLVRLADREPIAAPHAIAIGIMAAIGFALKPFFVPAWIALEAYVAIRRGVGVLWRPQAVALTATLSLYALGIVLWTPEYLAFAAESLWLYRAYQPYGDLPVVLSNSFGYVLLAVVLTFRGARSMARSLIDVCGILAILLSVAVFLQDKGWHYQWYPAGALATILLVVTAGAFAARSRFVTAAGVQGIATLIIVLLAARSYLFWTIDPPERHELETLVRRHANGEAILALSSHLHVGFPLVNETDVRWASRYPTMWQLPAFCERSATTKCRSQGRQFLDAVVADVTEARPRLLIVDSVPPTPSLTDFNYLEYFEQDPRLASALADYRFLRQIGRYRIFVRWYLDCGD
ncbi:MAG: hypothetical protein WD894_00185 [Pirellulales bacterium]